FVHTRSVFRVRRHFYAVAGSTPLAGSLFTAPGRRRVRRDDAPGASRAYRFLPSCEDADTSPLDLLGHEVAYRVQDSLPFPPEPEEVAVGAGVDEPGVWDGAEEVLGVRKCDSAIMARRRDKCRARNRAQDRRSVGGPGRRRLMQVGHEPGA